MKGQLLNEIAKFLADLEETQRALLHLFREKSEALRKSRAAELMTIANRESQLVEQMQQHLHRRAEILERSQIAGFSSENLADLLNELGGAAVESLSRRIETVRGNAAQLRRESWVQWIVAQRSYRHYSTLLDLIANRGRMSPTYDRRSSGSGALLDASV